MTPVLRLALLTLFLGLAACAPKAPPAATGSQGPSANAADEAAIQAAADSWNTAYNAGEVDKIVALYTVDAVLMPPDAPLAKGQAAIREYLAKDVAAARAAGTTVRDAGGTIGFTGDLGWHAGRFVAVDPTGKTVASGKYTELWRKVDGHWLMIRDIWNNDVAGTPPAAQ